MIFVAPSGKFVKKIMKNKMDKKEKEYLKKVNATYSTQGFKKLWNYFLEIAKTDYFQNKISDLRKKYNIPKEGFRCAKTYKTHPPQEWNNYYKPNEEKILVEIWDELRTMCKKYHLHVDDWVDAMEYYLFYNELRPVYDTKCHSICLLSDLMEDRGEPLSEEFMDSDDLFYPIAIRISPYATERDIVDYVKKMFPLIQEFQKPYIKPDAKIGKIKKKNSKIQERNDFIYTNRNLSINETRRLVEEKFKETLDYEYIGKIRSEEVKRRKEL